MGSLFLLSSFFEGFWIDVITERVVPDKSLEQGQNASCHALNLWNLFSRRCKNSYGSCPHALNLPPRLSSSNGPNQSTNGSNININHTNDEQDEEAEDDDESNDQNERESDQDGDKQVINACILTPPTTKDNSDDHVESPQYTISSSLVAHLPYLAFIH